MEKPISLFKINDLAKIIGTSNVGKVIDKNYDIYKAKWSANILLHDGTCNKLTVWLDEKDLSTDIVITEVDLKNQALLDANQEKNAEE